MLRRICSFLVSCAILLSLCCFVFFIGCSSNHNNTAGTTPPGSGGGTGNGSAGGGAGGGGGTGGSGTGGGGSTGGGTGGSGGGTGSGGGSGSGSGSAAEYLYMAASGQQGSVYEYKIDLTSGALTPASGSPFMANAGNPTVVCTTGCGASLVADPLGHFLFYQFNYGSTAFDGVDSLNVNATDGTLSSNSQILQPLYEPAIDPQGRFIYWNASSGQSNAVGGLDVASTGQLTTAPGQPYPFNGQTSYQPPAVSGNYVFATNYRDTASSTGQGELDEWTIDSSTGALTQTSNTMPLQYAAGAVVTPNGKFVYTQQQYLSNGTTYYEIVPVQIGTNGALTALTQNIQQTTSQGIDMIWMSPNGNFLYMGINGTDLWDYQIDQTTGALTLVQKYTAINEGLTLAIDPSAKYMFTSPSGANHVAGTTIAVYSVDSTTGALTPLPNDTLDTKVLPISLAVVSPH